MQRSTLLILIALSEGEADSGVLLARLRRLAGEEPSLATFYRRLKEGLDERWVEIDDGVVPGGRGRPAQVYRLTGRGRAAARVEAERWRAISDRFLHGEGSTG